MSVRHKKSIKWLIAGLSLAMISCAIAFMTASRPERVFAAVASPRCYQQTDARWNNYTYTIKANGQTVTFGASGCGIMATVNTVNYLTGNFINPRELADWGYENNSFNGTGGQGTYRETFYSNVTARFGATYGFKISDLTWGQITNATLINHLKNGGSAIIHVPNHFMAVNGYDSSTGKYLIYDSGAGGNRKTSSDGSWLTASQLNANAYTKADWFCLVSRTGSAPNYEMSGQYDLTVTSSGGGIAHFGNNVTHVRPSGNQIIDFEVVPNAGYKVSSIKINGVSKYVFNNGGKCVYDLRMPFANTNVAVTFVSESEPTPVTAYAVKTQVLSGEGTAHFGDGITSASFKAGTTVSVQVTPNSGYKTSEIKVNDTPITVVDNGIDHVYQFTMPSANAVVYVKFEAVIYTLKTQVLSGEGSAHFGDGVTSTVAQAKQQINCDIIPNTGYKISEIKVNDTPITVVDNGERHVYQFAMPSANAVVYVKFEAVIYTLKTQVLSGEGTAHFGDGVTSTVAQAKQQINCDIIPNTGYKISEIKVNDTPITVVDNGERHVYQFTMPSANAVVYVKFEAITYVLKTQILSGEGTAHFGNGVTSATVQQGNEINVHITPKSGYVISEITVNDTPIAVLDKGAERVYRFTMPSANAVVYVRFEAMLSLKAEVSGVGGKVDLGDGATQISLIGGDEINCRVTPSKGYKVSKILINNVPQGVRNSGKEYVYTFTMPTVDTVISVQFKKDESSGTVKNYYTITVNQSDGGRIRADAVEAVENTTITVVATPDEGFVLEYVTVNGKKITGNTFVLTSNSVITAKFVKAENDKKDEGLVVTEKGGCSSSLNEGGFSVLAVVAISAGIVLFVGKRKGN